MKLVARLFPAGHSSSRSAELSAKTFAGVLVSFGLTACNQIYGIEETVTYPDVLVIPPPDTDGDQVLDIDDICPEVFDRDQFDHDRDRIGDACDSCPLVVDTGEDFDGDSVADACDPRPGAAGDCLALFDGMRDPSQFGANWDIVGTAGVVEPSAEEVRLIPQAGNRIAIVAKANGVRLSGDFDVQVAGRLAIDNYNGAAVAGVSTVTSLAECAPSITNGLHLIANIPTGGTTYGTLSDAPTSDPILIRAVFDRRPGGTDLRCRLDWGQAVGVATLNSTTVLPGGNAGALANQFPFSVTAIALYEHTGTCSTPLRR